MSRTIWMAALSFLTLLAAAPPAVAQPASESFHPQAVESTSIWSTATSDTVAHLVPSAGLVLHVADDPVILQRAEDGNSVARLVDEQLKADLALGLGLFDRVELGLVLPVVLYQTGEESPAPESSDLGLSDFRASARIRILEAGGFGLAAQVTGYIPASDAEPYQSDGTFGVLPALVADFRSDTDIPVIIAANLGWELRENAATAIVETDDRFDYRAAIEVGVLPEQLHLMASTWGRVEAFAETPSSLSAEFLAGARIFWTGSLTTTVGAGGGLASGYGTPDFRAVLSLGYTPSTTDLDEDGVDDEVDLCPNDPEDIDGFEDGDGCPDFDNDEDGIDDIDDECPLAAEDFDQFEDEDGCPDLDNDGDGIDDFEDACPNEPGEARLSGCPLVDDDGDGIDASVDQCPDEPEDIDGFEDEDGCPDLDNDNDGIPDERDQCPNEPESINGLQDEDGCPDEGKSAVRLSGNRIEILERVYFDTGRATIRKRSYSVLRQVASVLEANPDIKLLRVQGHTDSRGRERANLELSQQRATSVKEFLIEAGIDATRLSARGYGESHPIAENDTAEGRAENRRVEFHIIERESR